MKTELERVLDLCETKGISRSELCRRTNIPVTSFANWVYRNNIPNMDALRRIALYFKVSVSYLLTGQEDAIDLEYETRSIMDRIAMLPPDKQIKAINLINSVVDSMNS